MTKDAAIDKVREWQQLLEFAAEVDFRGQTAISTPLKERAACIKQELADNGYDVRTLLTEGNQ